MAVYGIGAVIKLIEHIEDLERALERAGTLRVNPDPTVSRMMQEPSLRGAGGAATGFPLPPPPKKKRKATAYSKRYGKAFKKLAPKYKKKNGSWKKDGFRRCAAAARRMAKK